MHREVVNIVVQCCVCTVACKSVAEAGIDMADLGEGRIERLQTCSSGAME